MPFRRCCSRPVVFFLLVLAVTLLQRRLLRHERILG